MASDPPVFRGCPKCGGDLAAETLRGARALGCLHCDAVVLTRADLQQMLDGDAVTEEAETEESRFQVDTPTPGPPRAVHRRRGVHWAMAVALAMFTAAGGLVLGAGVVLGVSKLRGADVTVADRDESAPVLAGTVPEALPSAIVPEEIAPIEPVVPADPEPVEPVAPSEVPAEPVPARPVEPVKPKRNPVQRGWKEVENGDLFAAKDAFEEAYLADPGNGEAAYGVGYALYNLGKPAEAKSYLCKAVALNLSVDTSREANGLLSQVGGGCP